MIEAEAHRDTGPAVTPDLSWSPLKGMVPLSIFNFVMRILTLGLYHFWGKTEERRRIWSAIRLEREPLQYHGTGMELFLGMLVILGLVLLPFLLVTTAGLLIFGPQSPVNSAISTILYIIAFFLFGAGIYRAQRYRLSRTTWRGIRGGLDGTGWDYAWAYFWTTALIPLTLGWILPWRNVKLQSLVSNRMRFGDRYFSFDATSSFLYRRFVVIWLSGITLFIAVIAAIGAYLGATYGLVWAKQQSITTTDAAVILAIVAIAYLIYLIISSWYRSQVFNYFAAHTRFEGSAFVGTMRAPGLAWLSATNYLLVLLTLGILAPVAQMRSARYMIETLSFAAPVDFDLIAQTAADEKRLGEGIAQAFDVDAF